MGQGKKEFDWDRTTSLPPMLAGVLKGDEPLYLDLRWARSEVDLSRKHPKFASALARLSAAIRGRSLDEIFGDDVREQRRRLGFLLVGIATVFIATLFAGWQWNSAASAEKRTSEVARQASEADSQAHVSTARQLKESGNDAQALAHLAKALMVRFIRRSLVRMAEKP